MVASGVQSVRVAFSWAAAQPYQTWTPTCPPARQANFTDVGGVPTNFQFTDMIVGDAARERRHRAARPCSTRPQWDAVSNPSGVAYPARPAPYAAYLTALIGRYGPHGSFWRENPGIPKMPIRSWQIWNEPNLAYYWKQPFASSYVSLLQVAHAAIKQADPGAQVVLGALTNLAWKSLGQIYQVKGARNLFDVVAVNGFTKIPANVILFMRVHPPRHGHFGDGAKPLHGHRDQLAIGQGQDDRQHFDFITTEAGQARDIATLLPLLGAAAPVAASDRLLLLHVDGPGGPRHRPVQLLRPARLPQRRRDRQARPAGVQDRRARARGLQAQGRCRHELHQVGAS